MGNKRRHDDAVSALKHTAMGGIVGFALGLLLVDSVLMDGIGISSGALFLPLGFIAGSIAWLLRVQKERHERRTNTLSLLKPKRIFQRELPIHEPEPFSQRLAHYTGKSESELANYHEPAKSKMPFWSLVDFRSWHGPKSIGLIRYYLERIRDAVHRANGRHQ